MNLTIDNRPMAEMTRYQEDRIYALRTALTIAEKELAEEKDESERLTQRIADLEYQLEVTASMIVEGR